MASDPQTLSSSYTVTVRGLCLWCRIGIHPSERNTKQRVRVSVDLMAAPDATFPGEDRRRIIRYDRIVAAIRRIAEGGHHDLCEGLADRIAKACFDEPGVARVRVSVEKLDVFADAEGVGAVLERSRDRP